MVTETYRTKRVPTEHGAADHGNLEELIEIFLYDALQEERG